MFAFVVCTCWCCLGWLCFAFTISCLPCGICCVVLVVVIVCELACCCWVSCVNIVFLCMCAVSVFCVLMFAGFVVVVLLVSAFVLTCVETNVFCCCYLFVVFVPCLCYLV